MSINHDAIAAAASAFEKKAEPAKTEEKGKTFLWKTMPLEELVRHRDDITAVINDLAPMSLKDMSVEAELIMQFHLIRRLQAETLGADEVPTNQKAQVANTLGALIAKLADLQLTIYDSERFKRVENAVVRFIQELPADQQQAALDHYIRAVGVVED